MPEDPRVRSYFDARARPFDRLYDYRPGLYGRFEALVYRRLRLSFELTMAELGDLSAKRVLDIGCGPGRYAVAVAERGADVVGIDLSPEMLALARQRARDRGVSEQCRFVETGFDRYEPDAPFDIVLMMSFIEYRADVRLDLARLHELAIEKAIVNVPLPYSWQTFARRARHRLRASPPSFYVHSPAGLVACLEDVGFDSWRSNRGWHVAYQRADAATDSFRAAAGSTHIERRT